MKYKVKINDKSGFGVDLKPILGKLKKYFPLVDEKSFPLQIDILKKKDEMDHSFYDMESKKIHLNINPTYEQDRINYIFAHEFFHFVQLNSELIKKASSTEEEDALFILLKKKLNMSDEDVVEIFHDFLPREAEANTFAAMVTGVHYKRHKFSAAKKELRKQHILEAMANGPRLDKDQFYNHNGIRPPGVYSYHNTIQGHQTPYDDVWEERTNNMTKTLYMTIGVSGSGKSTYLKKHFSKDVIVSPDEIRKELTGDISNQSNDAVVWMTANKRINDILKTSDEVVLDATNVNSAYRKGFLAPFKKIPNLEFIALVFPSNVDISKERIGKDLEMGVDRSDVPDDELKRQYKLYTQGYPALKYQFDKIKVVKENELKLSRLLKEFKIKV